MKLNYEGFTFTFKNVKDRDEFIASDKETRLSHPSKQEVVEVVRKSSSFDDANLSAWSRSLQGGKLWNLK